MHDLTSYSTTYATVYWTVVVFNMMFSFGRTMETFCNSSRIKTPLEDCTGQNYWKRHDSNQVLTKEL